MRKDRSARNARWLKDVLACMHRYVGQQSSSHHDLDGPMMGERRRQGPQESMPHSAWQRFDGNETGSFVPFVFMLVTSDNGGREKGTKERHWISICA